MSAWAELCMATVRLAEAWAAFKLALDAYAASKDAA